MSDLPTAVAHEKNGNTGKERPVAKEKHRRKLSNYLLDKELQLRYVIVVTVMSAIVSSVLGYLIWRQGQLATAGVKEMLVDSGLGQTILEETMDETKSRDMQTVLVVTMFGVGLVVILSVSLIIFTHKVAGPLYKVTTYFDKMAEGRLSEVYRLRRGDMLQDFYAQFRETHKAVRDRHARDNRVVGNFLEACDRAGFSNEEFASKLDALRAYKRERDEALA